jgi:hypothetical protein
MKIHEITKESFISNSTFNKLLEDGTLFEAAKVMHQSTDGKLVASNTPDCYYWITPKGKRYKFLFGDNLEFSNLDNDNSLSPKDLEYFRKQNPNTSKLFSQEESKILKDPVLAKYYAQHVLGGRWPEAEKVILNNPVVAKNYARDVIKGRWPEAEDAIMKNPRLAAMYNDQVIKNTQ